MKTTGNNLIELDRWQRWVKKKISSGYLPSIFSFNSNIFSFNLILISFHCFPLSISLFVVLEIGFQRKVAAFEVRIYRNRDEALLIKRRVVCDGVEGKSQQSRWFNPIKMLMPLLIFNLHDEFRS